MSDTPSISFTDLDPLLLDSADLNDGLDSSTEIFVAPKPRGRVVLLETQPFLQDVYGQEVRNWSELRDQEPINIIVDDDSAAWLVNVTSPSTTIGIIDIDDLEVVADELYQMVRANPASAELPLIVLGTRANVARFTELADENLICLAKPLGFGVLMNTVRMRSREPVSTLP